eukprot:6575685-Alexandrium_andersonii.AAC.1
MPLSAAPDPVGTCLVAPPQFLIPSRHHWCCSGGHGAPLSTPEGLAVFAQSLSCQLFFRWTGAVPLRQ